MAVSASSLAAWPLPRFGSGSLALLKWLGLLLMVLDHVDAFAFHRGLTWAGSLGRLVFPIFAVVIGFNLARPSVGIEARQRILSRLLAFGFLAWPFHAALTGTGQGNILLTFAAAVLLVDLWESGQRGLCVLVFLVAGAVVEYGWPGLALVLSVWSLYRVPVPGSWNVAAVLVSWSALVVPNGSFLALWALPVVVLAAQLEPPMPRLRTLFYAFYPAHLAAFCLLLGV